MNDEIIDTESKPPVWAIILAFCLLLIFLAFVGWSILRIQQNAVAVGQPAPNFEFTSFSGMHYQKSELAGKIVVLNFWASWYQPCENEAAFLEQVWQKYKSELPVVFLGIDTADTDSEALDFIAKNGISYPNGSDTGTRIAKAFRITGVPETFILDQSGNIAYIKIGPFTSADELDHIIELILQK